MVLNGPAKRALATMLPIVGAVVILGALTPVTAGAARRASKQTLKIADVQTFTGATAAFGPDSYAGCQIAVTAINKAGGVLGHHLKCSIVDTRSDVVDSVPAVQKLVSVTQGVVGVYGPSTTTASADVPVINSAHIPMFADTGSTEFTHKRYGYFWRIIPADDAVGYAEALWAKDQGYKNIALMYVNNVSDEGSIPGTIAGAKSLGMKVVSNQPVPGDQTSYDTEVEALLAKHPTVIIGTMDPQTGATVARDLQQLNGGNLIPFVTDETINQPTWVKAIEAVVGKSDYAKFYKSVIPAAGTSGPAFEFYKKRMLASNNKTKQHWSVDTYAQAPYDSVTYMALAMQEAKSTKPSVYNKFIEKIANPGGKNRVVAHTFAQGKREIAKGHKIHYEGVIEDVDFNKFHSSSGNYVVQLLKSTTSVKTLKTITSSAVAKLTKKK